MKPMKRAISECVVRSSTGPREYTLDPVDLVADSRIRYHLQTALRTRMAI